MILLKAVTILIMMHDVYLDTNYSMHIFNDLKNTWLHPKCKSNDYLAQLTNNVVLLCYQFNSQKIDYMLDFGTLLGAMRTGSVIPWDHDCDFSIINFTHGQSHIHADTHADAHADAHDDHMYEHPWYFQKSMMPKQECEHFHRIFSQSDIDNDLLCTVDFKLDGKTFNTFANLVTRRVPCKYLTSTVKLSQFFPNSKWKHCNVPKQFNAVLSHYYGSHWNSSWKHNYQTCQNSHG